MYGIYPNETEKELASEEIFLQERADAQQLGDNDAEADDNESDSKGGCGVEDEVAVQFEECSYGRQLWQEEIVEQINIKCTTTDELEGCAKACLFEERVIIPEEHKDHREQEEHRQGVGQ